MYWRQDQVAFTKYLKMCDIFQLWHVQVLESLRTSDRASPEEVTLGFWILSILAETNSLTWLRSKLLVACQHAKQWQEPFHLLSRTVPLNLGKVQLSSLICSRVRRRLLNWCVLALRFCTCKWELDVGIAITADFFTLTWRLKNSISAPQWSEETPWTKSSRLQCYNVSMLKAASLARSSANHVPRRRYIGDSLIVFLELYSQIPEISTTQFLKFTETFFFGDPLYKLSNMNPHNQVTVCVGGFAQAVHPEGCSTTKC